MSKDFFIGGAAGIVSRTVTAPLELLRLQIQNNYLKLSIGKKRHIKIEIS